MPTRLTVLAVFALSILGCRHPLFPAEADGATEATPPVEVSVASSELPPPPTSRGDAVDGPRPAARPAGSSSRQASSEPGLRVPPGEVFAANPALSTVLEEAAQGDRPALLYFRSQRCGWCDRMQRDTFARSSVRTCLTSRFVAVKYDSSRSPGRELSRRFRLPGYPVIIVLDARGCEIGRVVGYRDASALLRELRRY